MRKVFIMTAFALSVLLSACGSSTSTEESTGNINTEVKEEPKGETGVEVKNKNPLKDFEYELKDGEIYITEYNGDLECLDVQSSYEVDGEEYQTNLSDWEMAISYDVKTIVFNEGIKTLPDAIFNCSEIQKVFLPKSLIEIYDNTLSYLSPEDEDGTIKIYYAGSKEEWLDIFKEYEAKSFDEAEGAEEKGEALADALNSLLDAEYDSSQFEFFFNATVNDVK